MIEFENWFWRQIVSRSPALWLLQQVPVTSRETFSRTFCLLHIGVDRCQECGHHKIRSSRVRLIFGASFSSFLSGPHRRASFPNDVCKFNEFSHTPPNLHQHVHHHHHFHAYKPSTTTLGEAEEQSAQLTTTTYVESKTEQLHQDTLRDFRLEGADPPFHSQEHYFTHVTSASGTQRLGHSPYGFTADSRITRNHGRMI